MKEPENINVNNPDIDDFLGIDIEAIKAVDDVYDNSDDNELESLRDDIKVKESTKLKFQYKDSSVVAFVDPNEKNPPSTKSELMEAVDNNILNDSMSIDMDMNMKDDPSEVGFTDTNEMIVDPVQEKLKLEKELKEFFALKRYAHERVIYDAALLDKIARLFASLEMIVNPEANIIYTPEQYQQAIEKGRNDFIRNPFFEKYFTTEVDINYIFYNGLERVFNNYKESCDIFAKDLRFNVNSFLGANLKNAPLSYDQVKDRCQKKSERIIRSKGGDARFTLNEYMDAIDLVIAKTLTTKAAKKTIFDKCLSDDNVNIDPKKLDERINLMRWEIRNDPKFLTIIEKQVSRDNFYKEYRRAVNDEINMKIKDADRRKKELEKDQKKREYAKSFLDSTSYNLAPDKIEMIQTTYADLVHLNKGKNPSEYMEKLIDAYEKIIIEISTDKGFVKASTINNLQKAALKYYDKRQGLITGPTSERGQARLEAVEKLIRNIEPVMKAINKDFNKGYKQFTASKTRAAAQQHASKAGSQSAQNKTQVKKK